MKIPISEIFQSIQWEWRNTWKPSVFLRFWGCNLHCTWCDTKYSWDPSVEKADIMELDKVISIIKGFKSKHIIFTWWEPSLYQNQMKIIQDILNMIWGYTYELETNWSNQIKMWYFDQINVSPKLKSSWNDKYSLKILWSSEIHWTNYDMKFVCSNLVDTKETDEFINHHAVMIELKRACIYIMPLWRDIKSQVNDYLVKYCIAKNYNYCLRQHLILFWDGKGK